MKKRVLGKGLGALIPDSESTSGSEVIQCPLEEIRPSRFQPRSTFQEKGLGELADSIREKGVLQPVMVRRDEEGGYELIAGERRWRAAAMAGLKAIPAMIRPVTDVEGLEIALVENLQREDLDPIEEARGYRDLIENFDSTQEDVAQKVGKDRSTVTNQLRLLKLPHEIQDEISAGRIKAGHARALLSLADREDQIALCRRIIDEGLSVRDAERRTGIAKKQKKGKAKGGARGGDPSDDLATQTLRESLIHVLGTQVKLVKGKKGGRIEIHFHSEEELQRIIDVIAHP